MEETTLVGIFLCCIMSYGLYILNLYIIHKISTEKSKILLNIGSSTWLIRFIKLPMKKNKICEIL